MNFSKVWAFQYEESPPYSLSHAPHTELFLLWASHAGSPATFLYWVYLYLIAGASLTFSFEKSHLSASGIFVQSVAYHLTPNSFSRNANTPYIVPRVRPP